MTAYLVGQDSTLSKSGELHLTAYHSLTTTVMRLPVAAMTASRTDPELRPRLANMLECGSWERALKVRGECR